VTNSPPTKSRGTRDPAVLIGLSRPKQELSLPLPLPPEPIKNQQREKHSWRSPRPITTVAPFSKSEAALEPDAEPELQAKAEYESDEGSD
jgi:hypothetical protein